MVLSTSPVSQTSTAPNLVANLWTTLNTGVGVLIWALVEIDIGIICACGSTLKRLFRHFRDGEKSKLSWGDSRSGGITYFSKDGRGLRDLFPKPKNSKYDEIGDWSSKTNTLLDDSGPKWSRKNGGDEDHVPTMLEMQPAAVRSMV